MIDVGLQIGGQLLEQIEKNPKLLEEFKTNPVDAINQMAGMVDFNKIKLTETALAAAIGTLHLDKNIFERGGATKELINQYIDARKTSKSKTKIKKLEKRLKEKIFSTGGEGAKILTAIALEQIFSKTEDKYIEGKVHEHVIEPFNDENNEKEGWN